MTEESIYSPFSSEIPLAFIYNDTKKGTTIYCGPYLRSIESFAQKYHYQLQLEHVENLPKKSLMLQQIAEGHYNMSVHGVSIRSISEDPLSNITQYSYPIEVMKFCVMVPLAPELPKWMYMVWPLGRYVWTSIFLSIFYVALLLRYIHRRETATRSYTRNVLHALAILMYSPNMNMQLQLSQPPVRMLIFYTLLYLQGFILSNYHISHMTSFDMKPVFVRPINTWSDLIESRVRIIIPDTLLEELRILPDYQQLLVKPPRKYAYVVTQDAWEFLDRQQRVLIQPYFHMSQVCFGGLFNAFPIQKNAEFADRLDRFVMHVQQSGLWDYWEDMAFVYAVRARFAQIFLDTYPVEPLNLEFFSTAWIVLVCGLPISAVVYCLEHLWIRWREMRRNYRIYKELEI
ncbi:uncharacterized protein Dvir_GJ20916 [Drosophila virilis]|uniref:Ionotropic glutamate receptor C-terminal domain-containing protein n=1 Tax=Drosophila virilis TaxID=7244 RepID=B4LQ08_DROVI|nr:uncharacterized protein LOC6626401 [Drosophila virilis]EDW60331.1 uncharacterized protein Dvir_GJ20916 [Drosophila virilis]